MINYKLKKKLTELNKEKYQNCILDIKTINQIIFIKKSISKLKIDSNLRKVDFINKNKNDETYKILREIYKKKKINKTEKKFLIEMYKKFNVNLSLKKSYYKNFTKKTNFETCFASYIYLGLKIKPSRYLNNLQLLNMIIKINDQMLINFGNIKNNNLIFLLRKLIIKEFNILSKFL